MPVPVQMKYRAFISYAHADTKHAKWLQGRIEGFRIDKDLIGRVTAMGPVPKTLRPVFRDQDDFTAGHTLGEQTLAALDASAALIVLCSPTSAKCHYVNQEVRLFKQRHPERPVVPVILDGKPGDPSRECFPPAPRIEFDWDPATAAANIIKHDVSFEDAMSIFLDPLALSQPDDEHGAAEERWITIGLSRDTKLLLVVHTHMALDTDTSYIRIISARKSTKRERRQYEQAPQQG